MSSHPGLASPSAVARTLVAPRRRVETAAVAVLGAAVVALYLPVLRELVAVWENVTYYSYGFVVPLFSAYLAWDTLKGEARRDDAGLRSPHPEAAGFLITAAGLLVLALGAATTSLTLRALSLPIVLTGLALALLGPALARRLAFPIGFLVFMAPLPEGTLPALSLPLQRLAAEVAEHALRALGITVDRNDLFLRLPSVTLHVTEACNGLRFLLAMLVVGVAFAATTQRRPLPRAAIVVAAVTVAGLANLVRVTGTGVMAELWGAQAAIGWPHIVWGKLVYAAALVPFVGLVVLMRRR